MARTYSARSKNRAQYLPAGQNGTHTMPLRTARKGKLPSFLRSTADLDWLDPTNPFFHTDRALFSAGQLIGRAPPPGMFNRRPGATILCDSGGLQYGLERQPWLGQASQDWVLGFLEAHADEAITLDVPTVAISRGPAQWSSFAACLHQTLANNAHFHLNRRRADLRLLSVLQGTTKREAINWYDAVKQRPFEGWAVAGALRRDYLHVADMIVRIVGDGLLDPTRNRIHVLGVSSMVDAVMLTAIQRGLREHLGDDDLQVTFDTSSPSKMVLAGLAYGYARIDDARFSITMLKPPSGHAHAGSPARFPVSSSRLAEHMLVGDLCVPSHTRQHGWDALGGELVTAHNIESMMRAFDDANAALEVPPGWQIGPTQVVRSYNALRDMWRFRNPMGHVTRFRADFAALSKV